MSVEETIQAIRNKCEVIRKQIDFIYTRAGIADATWKKYDANFTDLRAVLKAGAVDLIVLAQELEALIP